MAGYELPIAVDYSSFREEAGELLRHPRELSSALKMTLPTSDRELLVEPFDHVAGHERGGRRGDDALIRRRVGQAPDARWSRSPAGPTTAAAGSFGTV
jgi:hypothetical protein